MPIDLIAQDIREALWKYRLYAQSVHKHSVWANTWFVSITAPGSKIRTYQINLSPIIELFCPSVPGYYTEDGMAQIAEAAGVWSADLRENWLTALDAHVMPLAATFNRDIAQTLWYELTESPDYYETDYNDNDFDDEYGGDFRNYERRDE